MKEAYSKESPETIKELFGSIAGRYDFTNSFLTLHTHRLWNKKLVNALPIKPLSGNKLHLLDLCAGTGEIGYLWLKKQKKRGSIENSSVTFVDFCKEMLEIAQKRNAYESSCSFIEGDASDLPFQDNIFDGCSLAYGYRNIHKKEEALQEIFCTLKPGGTLGILELTSPKNPWIRKIHHFYLRNCVPSIGGLITGNKAAFSYLSSSIEQFPKPHEVLHNLTEAGFVEVSATPLFFGTTHLFLAKKPS
jgi:demethylmenaquinone methyltransferase / 2-methoxy-6-polyprenyl-1,4-benzoquinol methylase